jgi:hypothetical protein
MELPMTAETASKTLRTETAGVGRTSVADARHLDAAKTAATKRPIKP